MYQFPTMTARLGIRAGITFSNTIDSIRHKSTSTKFLLRKSLPTQLPRNVTPVLVTHAHRMSSNTTPEILVKVENNVQIITIDRQAKKNAINGPMYRALTDAIRGAAGDDTVNVIALTGKGEYFTAGNDMKDFESIKTRQYTHFVHALIDCKKPVIALVNGHAIGIGVTCLGLVDAVYASDIATFITPFSRIGISAEGCSSYTFPRIMGYAKASELLSFNAKITSQEAHEWGLVSAIYANSEFMEKSAARVNEIAQLPIKSLIYSKELVRGRDRDFLHKLNELEADRLEDSFKAILASMTQS